MDNLLPPIFCFLLIVLYFMPAIAANNRKHNNSSAIFILNLLLGWTFLGWVIAFIWANTDNVKQKTPELSQIEQIRQEIDKEVNDYRHNSYGPF